MNTKMLILNFILMLVAAVITALMVLSGSHYLETNAEKGVLNAIFAAEQQEKDNLQFVEIKNLVITLKSNSTKERYLLLDLALTTRDEPQTQRAEMLLPKIKGIAVDVLTSMNYSEVRSMSVMELRALMMERYQSAFHNIRVTIPFTDVTISKMVFQ